MGKLCPRGKAAAKRKFKVYPSAYANMYASAVCSGKITPGGKKGGGIVWLDFKQEFQPIEGLKQIVGHTYHKNGRVNPHHLDGNLNPADCDNLCIDNGLNEYIVISNGKLEIKKFLDI